jgi:hypothetical protein
MRFEHQTIMRTALKAIDDEKAIAKLTTELTMRVQKLKGY